MVRNLLGCAVLAAFLGGCAAGAYPTAGLIYSSAKAPVTATESSADSKVGKSVCTTILGLVATGDCSIDAAKANGGISSVSSVDYETFNILGIYSTYTTIVKGK